MENAEGPLYENLIESEFTILDSNEDEIEMKELPHGYHSLILDVNQKVIFTLLEFYNENYRLKDNTMLHYEWSKGELSFDISIPKEVSSSEVKLVLEKFPEFSGVVNVCGRDDELNDDDLHT